MIETILHGIQKGINAATPWLVGTAAGFFLLWLALLIREKKPFERELKWFAALTPFGKSAVMLMLGFFTWWGGAKERGASSPSANDDVSPTPSRVVETVQPRSLPEEISTNALRITAFSINQTNQTAYFETRCATNLFDHTASRNLYLFSSTNLLERRWTPLCMIQMPANTNVHSFVVAQSDVMPSMRHWFLDSFGGVGFYRFGADFDSDGDGVADDIERLWTFTDPDKFDTDGDGLSDGQELSYQVNTNPLAYDTDGDGVGDGDEVASGSNPRRDNSDLDELTDAQELGMMTALVENDFMWFDMSGGTDLLSGYSTLNSYSKEIPLASETVVNDVCYTNARVCLDGTVYLLCPTNLTGGYYYYSNLSNIQWSASHLTVALCGANLYARTSDWGSKILYGSLVSEGRSFDVVEYRNMGLYDHNDTNELITCQLMLPHDETNTIYVSYLCASNTFRDVSFVAGIQCGWIPSNKSGERFYNLSWPIVGDFPQDGLTIKYSIGTCTDPTKTDTDDDGLSDSDEVEAGTNPALADTDHDGLSDGLEDSIDTNPLQPDSDSDGMNDGWEYRYGFDPTVNNASDNDPDNDIGADPDGDGLTNGQECNFGTDPLDSDTDGDGVSDGAEVGQNSDPTDSADGGQPNSRVPAPFTFGDPSGSHSEKYTLEVTPVSGDGETPSSFSWLNENYGQCETKIAMLKPGWKYEVRLYHSGTNGSGDGYPDYDYELDFAGNDTTDGVIKDDPDGLFGTDYTSDSFAGEGKVAYVYALAPPKLVPDYNRDRAITDDDVNKVMQKKKLRFWINDDEDDDSTDGKYAESPSVDIPGALTGWWFEFDGRDPDWNDSKVNGYRDLIDFTPVFMDVSTIQMLPERIRNSLTFKLSHAAGAVNVVWSDLPKSSVGLFQRGNVGVCGRNLNEDSYEAETERVGADGIAVPDALVAQMKSSSSNKGVVFIEGREATSAPLKLDIYYNGQKVVTGELPLHLSSVEEMYWFYSIRGAESNPTAPIPNGNSPDNLMENPADIDIFFTHGFNVDSEAARGWGSEVFKRLWQSGSNARFHMVTWAGDYRFGEDMNPFEFMNGFFYHRDVQYALNSADAYKRLVKSVQANKSKRVLMAQSLGNMVTCEAIRLGFDAEKYYMFNAAVASEAIVSTLQNVNDTIRQKFVPPDWRSYNSLSWAANWFRLFPNDDRSHIGWPGYFSSELSGISEVCNYYSSGDPVLVSNADVPSALTKTLYVQWPVSFSWSWPFIRFQSFEFQATFERFAWQKQEVLKGVNPYLATREGGWGFHSWPVDLPNGETEWRTFTAQEAQEMVTNGSIVTNAVFERSVTAMFSPTIPLAERNRILAYNVPAVSESTGSVPTFESQSKFVNLNSSAYKNGWGRSGNPYNDQWLHSDMKDMAYYYVFRLYDELVQKIQGGAQ